MAMCHSRCHIPMIALQARGVICYLNVSILTANHFPSLLRTQHIRHKLQMDEGKYFARYCKHHVDPFVSEVKDGRVRQRGRRARTEASSDHHGRGDVKSITPGMNPEDTADDDDNGCGSDVGSSAADEVMTDNSRCTTPRSLIASPFPRTVSAPANAAWTVCNSHDDLRSTMMESDSWPDANLNIRQRSATFGPDHTIPSSYGGYSSSSTDASERPLPASPLVPHSRQTPPMRDYGNPDSGFPEVNGEEVEDGLKAVSPQPHVGHRLHAPAPTASRRTVPTYGEFMPLPPVGSSLIPIARGPSSTTPVEQHDTTTSGAATAWGPPLPHTSPFYGPLGPLLFALQSIDAAEAAQRMQQSDATGAVGPDSETTALLEGGPSGEPHPAGKWCADECVWRPWERIPAAGAAPRL